MATLGVLSVKRSKGECMRRSITGLLTGFVFCALCGCEPIQLPWVPIPTKGPPIDLATLPEANAMLEQALGTRAHFTTMEAKATMGIADGKNDFHLNTNVHIFA